MEGDLLQILALWRENATDDKMKLKISLACLELMVPMTWPINKDVTEMTVNHHRHMPYLQNAQLGYKRSIINFDGARILHTAIRCALPSMAQSMSERSSRDEGIIKLMLYFLRNIAMIAPPPNVKYNGDEAEVSRSATIAAFDYQDVFHLLLTLCSTMGEDFNTQDVVVLDVLFHLIKGVDIEKLFTEEGRTVTNGMSELARLRAKEKAMLIESRQGHSGRHSRFGATVWIQREGHKKSIVSGPSAISSAANSLAHMDSSKKFKPPRRPMKGESGPMDFDTPVPLNAQANKYLRTFVEEFLDSGFNPFFNNVRKAIDREAERVLEAHPRQFFYLVAWFLEAERVRRRNQLAAKTTKSAAAEPDSYAMVANVLNQEMFVTLNRAMDTAYENKSWQDLNAAMRCFTQILLTVQEMSESMLEEDQEIAENILSRIFYEETTHDRVANITRTYKDQGFGYLDSCTELAHNYLRILEQYSKQNVDLQVRTRRRVRRKKKAARDAGEDDNQGGLDGSDAEDEAAAARTTSERKFDFTRFAGRFLTQGCIDTFVTFTSYYDDLKPIQMKRAHRFFYRVAFKQEMSVMLFRVDIMALFHKMIKGPGGLDHSASYFREWDDIVKQLIKRCTRKIQERPELIVEMLFSKINSSAHYLEYGYEKQTITTKPRAAAELEVKPAVEWEEQIGVVVGAMLDRNEGDLLRWTKEQLSSAESVRRSWEDANQALPSVEKEPTLEGDDIPTDEAEPPKPPAIGKSPLPRSQTALLIFSAVIRATEKVYKMAMFKNGHLRLLMTLIGFRRVGADDDPEALWTIPFTLTAGQLKEALDLINKSEFSPPVFDDGKEAGDFIKRKSTPAAARKRQAFDDDDNGIDDASEEEFLFEPGGPTPMNKTDALKALKKTRRRRRKSVVDGEEEDTSLPDSVLQARADARRAKELEKNRKIKSELFVHDSDEEEDEERDRIFFEAEEKLRQRSKVAIMKELLGAAKDKAPSKNLKRQSSAISLDSDEEPVTGSRHSSATATAREEDASDESASAPKSAPKVKSSKASKSTKPKSAKAKPKPAKSKRKSKAQEPAEDPESSDDFDFDAHVPREVALEQAGVKRRKVEKSAERFVDSDDEDEDDLPAPKSTSKAKSAEVVIESDDEDVENRAPKDVDVVMIEDNDEEDEDAPVVRAPRPRVRAGFIVDSSDEE